ncbi:MAG: YIP1 family protein [Actinomycetia bacterium]|nr:YIP1 family protein [Actinomycetes bacterium]
MQWTSFPKNVASAAMLDSVFYNRAEVERGLEIQALVVVVVANGMAGFGSSVATDTNILGGIGLGILSGVFGWLIWSLVAMIVGTRVFHGTSDFGQMRRVIGFAYAPLAIGVIPWLGFIGAAWVLVAAVIAIREGMDFSTKRSIATMALGWGAWLGVTLMINVLFDLEMRSGWPF